ncbi:uncharacterized protein LOC116941177 [Petromyzon marinus]|uniref:Uncharacterized protein LOC116941177 n=1 Tax=Petromyzon marinus TaxID=7757 RepID=A0AAJ7T0D5_PETMA|nr:uncharacterized protein LOC116941177 [Petromyzon marinus]
MAASAPCREPPAWLSSIFPYGVTIPAPPPPHNLLSFHTPPRFSNTTWTDTAASYSARFWHSDFAKFVQKFGPSVRLPPSVVVEGVVHPGGQNLLKSKPWQYRSAPFATVNSGSVASPSQWMYQPKNAPYWQVTAAMLAQNNAGICETASNIGSLNQTGMERAARQGQARGTEVGGSAPLAQVQSDELEVHFSGRGRGYGCGRGRGRGRGAAAPATVQVSGRGNSRGEKRPLPRKEPERGQHADPSTAPCISRHGHSCCSRLTHYNRFDEHWQPAWHKEQIPIITAVFSLAPDPLHSEAPSTTRRRSTHDETDKPAPQPHDGNSVLPVAVKCESPAGCCSGKVTMEVNMNAASETTTSSVPFLLPEIKKEPLAEVGVCVQAADADAQTDAEHSSNERDVGPGAVPSTRYKLEPLSVTLPFGAVPSRAQVKELAMDLESRRLPTPSVHESQQLCAVEETPGNASVGRIESKDSESVYARYAEGETTPRDCETHIEAAAVIVGVARPGSNEFGAEHGQPALHEGDAGASWPEKDTAGVAMLVAHSARVEDLASVSMPVAHSTWVEDTAGVAMPVAHSGQVEDIASVSMPVVCSARVEDTTSVPIPVARSAPVKDTAGVGAKEAGTCCSFDSSEESAAEEFATPQSAPAMSGTCTFQPDDDIDLPKVTEVPGSVCTVSRPGLGSRYISKEKADLAAMESTTPSLGEHTATVTSVPQETSAAHKTCNFHSAKMTPPTKNPKNKVSKITVNGFCVSEFGGITATRIENLFTLLSLHMELMNIADGVTDAHKDALSQAEWTRHKEEAAMLNHPRVRRAVERVVRALVGMESESSCPFPFVLRHGRTFVPLAALRETMVMELSRHELVGVLARCAVPQRPSTLTEEGVLRCAPWLRRGCFTLLRMAQLRYVYPHLFHTAWRVRRRMGGGRNFPWTTCKVWLECERGAPVTLEYNKLGSRISTGSATSTSQEVRQSHGTVATRGRPRGRRSAGPTATGTRKIPARGAMSTQPPKTPHDASGADHLRPSAPPVAHLPGPVAPRRDGSTHAPARLGSERRAGDDCWARPSVVLPTGAAFPTASPASPDPRRGENAARRAWWMEGKRACARHNIFSFPMVSIKCLDASAAWRGGSGAALAWPPAEPATGPQPPRKRQGQHSPSRQFKKGKLE